MKRLALLRHAKAVAKGPTDDAARELSGAGKMQMGTMARAIIGAGVRPDLALVSTAVRTRESWALAGLPDVPARFEDAIYDATEEELTALVAGVPDEVGTLMMVGHNPGFEELAIRLGDAAAQDALGSGLPTAALVILDLPIEHWAEIGAGRGRLVRFATPDRPGGAG